MRIPTRLHITWENENTLRIDTDAGTQTRRLLFNAAPPPDGKSLQGFSRAEWERLAIRGAARGAPPAEFVTSTHFRREPDGSKWDPTVCKP